MSAPPSASPPPEEHAAAEAAAAGARPSRRSVLGSRFRTLALLGPAFVAAVAYLDPGNVAVNISAGAKFGYLLVWVLLVSNAMAVFVQYQSAKLGIVTGASLPELIGQRTRNFTRRAYWVQAEIVVAATDIAEVLGGAIALYLLFSIPLPVGGLIVGIVAIAILSVQNRRGQRSFEAVIVGFLLVIAIGFLTGLFVSEIDWPAAFAGVVPRFDGAETVLLAAGMLGATVMPHAIYVHSTLSRDRHGQPVDAAAATELLRITRIDVVAALLLAGTVNIAMLLLAASSLSGIDGTDTIEGAYAAIAVALGPAIAVVFGVGLLASGFASTAVGSHAGANITAGLLRIRVPMIVRRVITLIPALLILAFGVDVTWALVLSQVVLSLGIPFALIPLLKLTGDRALMGVHVNRLGARIFGVIITFFIVALNVALVALTIFAG